MCFVIRIPKRLLIMAVIVLVLGGCAKREWISPSATDASPPALTVTSVLLKPDLNVSHTTTGWEAGNLTDLNTDPVIFATASDPESGIGEVTIEGRARVWCDTPAGGTVLQSTMLQAGGVVAASASGTRPASYFSQLPISISNLRALCAAPATFRDLQIDLVASGQNGAGMRSSTRYFSVILGPRSIRIMTLNMFAPCLRTIEAGSPNCPWPVPASLDQVFLAWGTTFRNVDIVLLQEVQSHWIPQLMRFAPQHR